MSSIFEKPLAFVDIETTGGSHFKSRVLEVAVVRVEHNRVVGTYQSLIAPDEPIPAFITGLTGITDEDVLAAPRFSQVSDELADILDGAVFVAHNVGFDYGFLKMEFERLGAMFVPELLCTVRLSRRLYPQYRTHKLEDLIVRHRLDAPMRHRAYDDANCLWQFYQLVMAEFDLDTIESAVQAQLRRKALPSELDPAEVAKLPEGPGVYIFDDDDGAPLYVGKSVAVRRRVMSHFAAGYANSKELKLSQAVRKLRGIATHGELSALLLESDLIKALQPIYNRTQRRQQLVTLLMACTTQGGYSSVQIVDAREVDSEAVGALLGVYGTAAAARRSLQAAVKNFRLCPKLLGLERADKECFLAQLGKCDRACTGDERADIYNARFAKAFASGRVDAWPYSGPVMISEQHQQLDGSVGFVVDAWCVVARLTQLEDGYVETIAEARRFDLDRYHIIQRFLSNPRNRQAISVLSPAQLSQIVDA